MKIFPFSPHRPAITRIIWLQHAFHCDRQKIKAQNTKANEWKLLEDMTDCTRVISFSAEIKTLLSKFYFSETFFIEYALENSPDLSLSEKADEFNVLFGLDFIIFLVLWRFFLNILLKYFNCFLKNWNVKHKKKYFPVICT